MNMGKAPLYPPSGGCGYDNCMRMPLFRNDCRQPPQANCGQTVRLENPCCPGEYAEVSLSVDHCGNLTVCVRRDFPDCGCRPKKRCW